MLLALAVGLLAHEYTHMLQFEARGATGLSVHVNPLRKNGDGWMWVGGSGYRDTDSPWFGEGPAYAVQILTMLFVLNATR